MQSRDLEVFYRKLAADNNRFAADLFRHTIYPAFFEDAVWTDVKEFENQKQELISLISRLQIINGIVEFN